MIFFILFFCLFIFFPAHTNISFFCSGGHAEVNRSLQQGCAALGVTYNWNPDESSTHTTVIVLAGVDNLRKAITLKEKGIIHKLLVGPTMFVRSNECNSIMAHPIIDRCIVPCDWVRVAYEEDAPSLTGRIIILPAGVDPEYWRPTNNLKNEKKNVVLYWKTEGELFVQEIKKRLCTYGWNPIIVKYGNYNHQSYRQLLENAAFAVFISVSESQGLALAEAWAMNIPTIVWDCQELYTCGKQYTIASSCPYLTQATGLRWKTINEFEKILQELPKIVPHFTPREWILENMTYKISVQLLLDIIEQI